MSLLNPISSQNSSSSSPKHSSTSIPDTNSNRTGQTSQIAQNSANLSIEAEAPDFRLENLDDYPNYTNYVQTLARQRFPTLEVVLHFLESKERKSDCPEALSEKDDGCILCYYFRLSVLTLSTDNTHEEILSFDRHSGEPSRKAIEEMICTMTALAKGSPRNRLQRFIILVENLKPRGMKLLGSFLNVDPRVFERLVNFEREFTNGLENVHVLNYCQGYFYRDAGGAKVSRGFKDDILATSKIKGKLRRWWKDIVGHEQRIVVAALPETSVLPLPVDIILFQPRPLEKDLEFKSSTTSGAEILFQLRPFELMKDFPLFFHFQEKFAQVQHDLDNDTWDNMTTVKAALRKALEDTKIPINLRSFSGAVTFVTEKWLSLTDQIQEVISETEIPDSANLPLIGMMIKRKHLFSEVKRTIETLCETLNASELITASDNLIVFEKKIERWIGELESTLSVSMTYLSLDETKRAMMQSTRTTQLTILAFVFIPASAVASGFGMNVDVLQSNPSIHWFVITTTTVALATFIYAAFFQVINNGFLWTGLRLFSFSLDVIVSILKVFAIPCWWVLVTLSLPFILVCLCILALFSNNARKEIPWWLLVLYFNGSNAILRWSPSILDVRRTWRAGTKAPKIDSLDIDKYTIPDSGSCIVM